MIFIPHFRATERRRSRTLLIAIANGRGRNQFAAGCDGGWPWPGGHNRKVPPLPTRKSYFCPDASITTQYPLTRACVYIIPGFRASQRAVVPHHRFCAHDHPVARDPPWPTRQPPSGLDRGLLAAFVLSRFSLPGLVRLCPRGGEGQDSSKRKRYAARASIVPLFRKRTEMVRRHEVYVSNPYDELSEFPCRCPY